MATSARKKSAPQRSAAAKKSAAGKQSEPVQKTTARNGAAKTSPAKKTSAVKKSSSTTAAKKTAAKTPAKKAPTKRVAMKTNENRTPATAPAKSAAHTAETFKVKPGEDPWTAAELAELRAELEGEVEHLKQEIKDAEQEIAGLFRDGSDGAGNDQADVGSTTLERYHELTLANNARDMLNQIEFALTRIDDGTYGVCDNCGNAIGKGRLQAFPRATLCVSCKERQERR
ncbi:MULTISPECIES: TraR/DksA C4-type zinc finger protein [Kribbella]|jgi:DnaK suppressor protein|uniref:TraR/DksA family transcriptional regulator n=1 Tax=Kribbella pratensis TaxID=2512112 RepID=A0ABY2FLM8_9ACTN|nr:MULTISPECIES: TraR/DksA C4-type zinc finger protein [Kribbella]TDW94035.1 TraR/DksA family transcriptional regulator [Kribbella pratensis]TDX02642.1 TraR/DksA family transcriptional regulator [Kribbella sp. VKM Ac-2566]